MSYAATQSAPAFPQTLPLDSMPVLPTQPLSNVEMARQENDAIVKLVVGIIVFIVIAAIIYWIYQQMQGDELKPNPSAPPRRRASRASTKEMARALYKRLEARGGVSDTTMRSLQQLGRR